MGSIINIVVIGENCKDIFSYCNAERLSPEAPVPVLTPIEVRENDGMSGNVVNNLKSISNNVIITHIHQPEIIKKTRFVDKKSNHMFIRFDEGEDIISRIKLEDNIKSISNADIVIVSDYNKGFLNSSDLIEIGKLSKLSILDSKRKICEETNNSFSFIKINEKESSNNKDIDYKNVLVTLGSKGTMFRNKIYPSKNPKETIDVSGAGDTFTSSFILRYFKSKNVEESIRYANEMASIVVSKRGVSTPTSI